MKLFRRPQDKAMVATFVTTSVLFLGLTGLFWLTVNYADQMFALMLGFGVTWFMYSTYQRYLESYKNKAAENE